MSVPEAKKRNKYDLPRTNDLRTRRTNKHTTRTYLLLMFVFLYYSSSSVVLVVVGTYSCVLKLLGRPPSGRLYDSLLQHHARSFIIATIINTTILRLACCPAVFIAFFASSWKAYYWCPCYRFYVIIYILTPSLFVFFANERMN